uniref:Flagellar biosynthesis protein FliS n=1 Tax=Caenorhabditis tropicalis TaxID=1561998 RepID=A0A1I7T5Q2_9PELO
MRPKRKIRVMSRAAELKKYLEDEAELGYTNLKKAEAGIKEAMKKFVEMLDGYHIDKARFDEVIYNYDNLFVEYDEATKAYNFKKLKRLTVLFEIATNKLTSLMGTFSHTHRTLIAEAAAAWKAANDKSDTKTKK